ncbi:hypothetical protein KJA15_00230 [Patescibacteria group bacterium]|nr:hypothetical protein [Patescibacteria group bacterium]
MVVITSPGRKRQRYLIFIFIAIVLGAVFILAYNFLIKPRPLPPEILPPLPPKIEINFELLKSPLLREFQSFEKISSFEEEIGRENPFIPY